MKVIGGCFWISVVAVIAIAGVSNAATADSKPNILLVMVDDMGWTDLGSYGSEIETPNLDALAQQGVQFTNFYASVSCSPTRSMLLSGTDNHLAGMGNMGELLRPEQIGKPGYEGYLNDRVVSLAEVLRDGGYHTYMAGKWHLGHDPERFPHARGFDRSFSMLLGGASYWNDMFGLHPAEARVKYVIDDNWLDELPAEFYATRGFTDFLLDAIRENHGDGKPFLAYLAFTAPHDPMHVPEPWLSKYRGDYDSGYDALKVARIGRARELGLVSRTGNAPERHATLDDWASLSDDEKSVRARGMEIYAGMVSNMDYHYGRVIDFLKDIGEYDNTIIVFLSDNGPNPWDSEDYPGMIGSEFAAQFDNSLENLGHPMSNYAYGMGWASASSGPLNRFKMTVSEGGIRVPLIVSGPGIEGDRQADGFAYVWDLMPTLLEYAGVDHPERYQGRDIEPLRGRSLASVLEGLAADIYGDADFIGGEMGNGKWMRQGPYKAVSVAPPYGPGTWQLYDVVNDPGETRDLAEEMPQKLKALRDAWETYAAEVGVVLSN